MRALWMAGLCCGMVGCDPVQLAAIQIAPRPATEADSTAQAVFALVSRVATRHGLTRFDSRRRDYMDQAGWVECFGYSLFILCGKVNGPEVQLRMWQRGFEFAPVARTVRAELLDSLGARFGGLEVRECKWRMERDERRSGCPLLTPRDSSDLAVVIGDGSNFRTQQVTREMGRWLDH